MSAIVTQTPTGCQCQTRHDHQGKGKEGKGERIFFARHVLLMGSYVTGRFGDLCFLHLLSQNLPLILRVECVL